MSERKKLKMISSSPATSPAVAAAVAVPDPEVRAVAKRRQFSAAYKLSVLEEADRCASPGAIGALLRREGLYSSHLTMWRRERDAGALAALGRRRGRQRDAHRGAEAAGGVAGRERSAQARARAGAHDRRGAKKTLHAAGASDGSVSARATGANLERGGRTGARHGHAACAACARGGARHLVSPTRPAPAQRLRDRGRPPPLALSGTEREAILATLNSPRFADCHALHGLGAAARRGDLPRLGAHLLPGARRRAAWCTSGATQLVHPAHVKPELVATAPNQVWSLGHHAAALRR